MGSIRVEGLSKKFGGVPALSEVSLDIADGEFAVLVGPSGCGKSTLLRLLAGLEQPTSGSITVDERDITSVPPAERDMAFVFQSYALYPHMSVSRNIAFPLLMQEMKTWQHLPVLSSIRKAQLARRADIRKRVESVEHALGISELSGRYPRALSGGQRQRVALGRAIVRHPNVFLMDEPLSNLDAKLRTSMRAEISRLHADLGATFVYVTHDQTEAMTMATQIYVMRDGVVQQSGSPQQLFDEPANAFVARFLGSPPMNLLPAYRTPIGHYSVLAGIGCWDAKQQAWSSQCCTDGLGEHPREFLLGIRPEDWTLGNVRYSGAFKARVTLVEYLGSDEVVSFRFENGVGQPYLRVAGEDSTAEDRDILAKIGRSGIARGDTVAISTKVQPKIFDYVTGKAV